ncbi:hypothetical protein TrST_g2126 [Triparma strigata]|uniref:RNA helicase n=1 Tax=Triparma strigata TaxID=1606541 RepID=A0A9W7EMC7_9STRA|nr:hypothetical protein TrST_g2126 [Triparma strigata]
MPAAQQYHIQAQQYQAQQHLSDVEGLHRNFLSAVDVSPPSISYSMSPSSSSSLPPPPPGFSQPQPQPQPPSISSPVKLSSKLPPNQLVEIILPSPMKYYETVTAEILKTIAKRGMVLLLSLPTSDLEEVSVLAENLIVNRWGGLFLEDEGSGIGPLTGLHDGKEGDAFARTPPTSLTLASLGINHKVIKVIQHYVVYLPPSPPAVPPSTFPLKLQLTTPTSSPTLSLTTPPINPLFSYTITIKTDLPLPLTLQISPLPKSTISASKYITTSQRLSWYTPPSSLLICSAPPYFHTSLISTPKIVSSVVSGGGKKSYVTKYFKDSFVRRGSWRVFTMKGGEDVDRRDNLKVDRKVVEGKPYKVLSERINNGSVCWEDVSKYIEGIVGLLEAEEDTVCGRLEDFCIYEMKLEKEFIKKGEVKKGEEKGFITNPRLIAPDVNMYGKCEVCEDLRIKYFGTGKKCTHCSRLMEAGRATILKQSSTVRSPAVPESEFTPESLAAMHQDEVFMLSIVVKGVGESRPPLSFLDAVRFRFEYRGVLQEVVGIIMDIKIKNEEVTIRMPSPMTEDAISFNFEKNYSVVFHDTSLLPYYRFLLHGLRVAVLDLPSCVDPSTTIASHVDYAEVFTVPEKSSSAWDEGAPRFSVNFGLGQQKGIKMCQLILKEAKEVKDNENLSRVVAPIARPGDGVKELPRDSCDREWEYFHEGLNREQRNAIYDIFYNLNGPVPYILFGPPGTGKTLTFVESILQLALRPANEDARVKILVCAPSDAAADVIAIRLKTYVQVRQGSKYTEVCRRTNLIRLNHFQRKASSLPAQLLSLSPTSESGMFMIPPTLDPPDLSMGDNEFREPATPTIVVSTCFSSSLLPESDLPFTHLFVDEAAQATEAEVLIPILHAGKDCSVMLGGDPRQLGPSIFNNEAGRQGLALSLLERLMALDIYTEGKFAIITKLKNNYRSHKALLDIPSALFYDNELECFAEKSSADMALKWEGLEGANSDFPMLFYDACEGKQMNEVDNPSLFNYHECNVVKDFIAQLLKSDTVNVSTKHIAVITPFRAQVLQMRKVLRTAGFSAVGVGQVEDYQGGEQKIVIISCVQTEKSKLGGAKDGGQGYGFVEDSKRFNVAVSRAKALNIIVGNVNYLNSTGTYWEAMIAHCKDNFAIAGDEESEHVAELGFGGGHYSGINELTDYVEMMGLGASCEDDKLEQALRGYYNGGDSWRIQL